MITVLINPRSKFAETVRRLVARLVGLLRSLSVLKPYRPEAHYMRGRDAAKTEKATADDGSARADERAQTHPGDR